MDLTDWALSNANLDICDFLEFGKYFIWKMLVIKTQLCDYTNLVV